MKTLHFCTLFNSHYLTRGLVMYFSLEKHCPDFRLYVIAFDDLTYHILTKLNLPHLVVISLQEFEDPELLRIKPTRNEKEYCWTCSSSSIYYTIRKYNLDMCTYVDADLLFFANPQLIIDEMKDASVLLTEHRLASRKKTEQNGTYCVQFMPFKNNEHGMTALSWWRDRCIEWCYDRFEDGKLGDQKYLNDWTTRFPGVHVMEHIGGGVAPWNMFRYEVSCKDKNFIVREKSTKKDDVLIFYHFQSTKIFDLFGIIKTVYWPYDYALSRNGRHIYSAYGRYIQEALASIHIVQPDFHLGFAPSRLFLSYIFRKIMIDAERLLSYLSWPFRRQLQKV